MDEETKAQDFEGVAEGLLDGARAGSGASGAGLEAELRRGVPAEGSWDQNSVSVIPTSATPERGDLGQPALPP